MSEESKINIPGIAKGVAFSLVITFILLLLIAAACYFFTISDSLLSVFVMAAVGASVFLSSLFVSKNTARNGLLHGLILASVYMLIIVLSGILVKKAFSADMHLLTSVISALAFGALGGIAGVR